MKGTWKLICLLHTLSHTHLLYIMANASVLSAVDHSDKFMAKHHALQFESCYAPNSSFLLMGALWSTRWCFKYLGHSLTWDIQIWVSGSWEFGAAVADERPCLPVLQTIYKMYWSQPVLEDGIWSNRPSCRRQPWIRDTFSWCIGSEFNQWISSCLVWGSNPMPPMSEGLCVEWICEDETREDTWAFSCLH